MPVVVIILIVVFGGVFVLGILAALLLPAVARATRAAKQTACANNLRMLWTLQMNYCIVFGGRMKKMPEAVGSAFWLALATTEPPLIEASELETLVCPFSGETPRAGFTSYRGPSRKVAELAGGDAVGCCLHADGSAVVLSVPAGLWTR